MPVPAGGSYPTSADQLATPQDLASLVQRDWASLTAAQQATATLIVEICTAVVQAAADGQRIVEVAGDTATLTGTTESWLRLPQIPVSAVASVTLDGEALTAGAAGSGGTTYRLRGDRLWRGDGWQTYCGEPSEVVVVYTHGYASGAQRLQLGRGAVLGLGRGLFVNADGVLREQIDDYAVAYEAASEALDASPILRAALRWEYGPRGGLVRIG
jgi:hypothetical protein